MLEVDPRKRISTVDILNHKWLKDVASEMDIFTETEKSIIAKEYTCQNTRRLNRNAQNQAEYFTEHNLDSTCNSLIKNCSTKSVILAPFNSTKTHISSFHSSVLSLVENDAIILHARIRDRDRQYMNNNNCELDNGVYNKHVVDPEEEDKVEKEDSLKQASLHESVIDLENE